MYNSIDQNGKKYKELFGCITFFKVYFVTYNSDSHSIYIFIKTQFFIALLKHDLLNMAVIVVHIQAIHFLHFDQLQSFVDTTQFYRENGCCSGPVETDTQYCEVAGDL